MLYYTLVYCRQTKGCAGEMIVVFEIKDRIIGKGMPKICVPVMAADEETLDKRIEAVLGISKEAYDCIDIIEFRGDFFEGLSDMERITGALNKLSEKLYDKIILFTIRSKGEGGEQLSFDKPDINAINRFVIEHKLADMVDIELGSGDEIVSGLCEAAKASGVKTIISNHDFYATPDTDEMIDRLVRMERLGGDIAKLAVMPNDRQDVIRLLMATEEASRTLNIPVVSMSMGKLGAVSRITGQAFGSAITFSSVNEASAPGQIPIEYMKTALWTIDAYCCE